MKKGKLESGFEFEIDENVLDDMEMIDALCDMQEGKQLAASVVVRKLFGKEQRNALYDHLRRENGTVPPVAVLNAVEEIFDSLGEEGKKS